MSVLFAVFLNEQMMKTKTETNKQTKSDISTSERQPGVNGCQRLTHAQSYFSETGACGLLLLSLLGLLSINQAAEQKKKKTTTTTTTKRNTPRIGVRVGFFFFFFSFFKVFTECPCHFMRNALTLQDKTTAVNTASFNSKKKKKKKNNNSNDIFPFC